MYKRSIFATLAVCTTISLTALAVLPPQYTTSWGTITRIESFGDDFHVFGLDLAPNPGACGNTTLAKVQYSLSAAKKEGLGRALTAAFLAGREVRVKLQDVCEGSNPAIYGVQVR